ncbi:D-alanyl-D-alanine carboxypeptidase family protein [Arthrobacter psychrochitiniphilus]|uniref:D-alanyl-D-alanine carboxypeptidase-like core domain-containing protein n=1 Tax=Arthrobacter psychrochitiniphilus TaxID=291045 RepID=A0A2V3DQW3_9MICC|nr:D-alanyl-D-alanine carboxypeptidase family protein [Arthrobacter psychrochitiniphilus]NYG18320.1 D-alanyl-D-alanine carboxypeptidase [Arthrobacter psychrochitiniphilus]PXA64899.1 hypothetical protein CVS29_11890 [Arthrobacter psychrochitiniphilus]
MQTKRLISLLIAAVAVVGMTMGGSVAAVAQTPDNGAIATKHASGGNAVRLGNAKTPLRCSLPQGGCYRDYRNGSIYWSPASGAHIVLGAISARWATFNWERGLLGYPISDENCTLISRGCVQQYQGGNIYWQSSVGAHTVRGGIGSKWGQMGFERSPLGYPVGEENCAGRPVSCLQLFLGGTITWKAGSAVSVNPNAGSIGIVVNKRRPNAPINRIPPDLVWSGSQLMRREAATQMSQLISGASAIGVPVTLVSGFRSYDTQAGLYNNYVWQYGQAVADTISARPGYSEHQTGLVMDIGTPNGTCALQACFVITPAGQFAAANAWRYGFIVRYPQGYDSITGYSYEPWHLRYIGVRAATDMRNRGFKTLEQYFGLSSAPKY